MTREEQIKEYISTFIEQYAESAGCNPKEVEHLGNFIRIGINWADCHPKDEINWQQARIQAAIAAMRELCVRPEYNSISENVVAAYSVRYADALVKELKGE